MNSILCKFLSTSFSLGMQLLMCEIFTDEEIFSNPLKAFEFTNALGQYDWSIAIKYLLNWEVKGQNFVINQPSNGLLFKAKPTLLTLADVHIASMPRHWCFLC